LVREELYGAAQSCATIVLPFNANTYRSEYELSNVKQLPESVKRKQKHKRVAST